MEIIHVMGHSCAGKRTLIKRLCDQEETALRDRFQISGSVDRYFSKHDPRDVAFDPMEWRPVSDLETSYTDHMLHKWQFDTQKLIGELKRLRPDVGHRAIALWRPCVNQRERIVEKGWWTPSESEMRAQMQNLLDHIHQVAALGIPVEYVDATTPFYDKRNSFRSSRAHGPCDL